ncbi:MAG: hypothetical protein HUJ60_02160 [Bacilli bacterium]|nr:hypothetical protein [Bacilli bacterium]
MKENITLEAIVGKGQEAYSEEIARLWLEDLMKVVVKRDYLGRNLAEELDKHVGGDLNLWVNLEEWRKWRGYISLKEGYNSNKKRFEEFFPIEEIDAANSEFGLHTDIDFFGRHHLRMGFIIKSIRGESKRYEFSVNLHAVAHLANLTLLQLFRAFDFYISVAA